MRYYSIILKDPDSGKVLAPLSNGQGLSANPSSSYTSFVNGQSLPGAQDVELNIPVSVFSQPNGAAFVRIWGVSLAEIGQANDLVGKDIQVFGGMQKGLPLAKPAQAGLLLQGKINQAFGNWIGTEQTLDLIVIAGTGSLTDPKNIVLHWKKGTKLSDTIQSTLSTAFPQYTADIKISDDLVLTEDEVGFFGTMEEFSSHIEAVSTEIKNDPDYHGVRISLTETKFKVRDGTTPADPLLIAFEDMIGQPTWIDTLTVQFKCTMRSDIQLFDYVKFPPAVTTTTKAGAIPLGSTQKQSSIFQGVFLVSEMFHFGRYRSPTADAWNTTFNVVSAQTGGDT